MASPINMAGELAEPNCNVDEGVVEISRPFTRQYSLRNGNEGVVAAKKDCDVGDGERRTSLSILEAPLMPATILPTSPLVDKYHVV